MEATTTEKNGPNNYLNDRQSYELVTWLKGNQVPLQAHSATANKCAEMAAHDLGFLVTAGNIRGKLEQFPECRWKPVKTDAAGYEITRGLTDLVRLYQMLTARVADLEKQNQIVSARTACLEAELSNIIESKELPEQTRGNGRLFREA